MTFRRRRLHTLLVIGTAVVSLAVGVQPLSAETADDPVAQPEIVGGTNARPGEFPYQVGLLQKGVGNRFYAQFCGGSMISPIHVLTAAHCVDGLTASDVDILAGTHDLNAGGRRVGAMEIYIHPNWNSATTAYDAAVVEIALPGFTDTVFVAQPGQESLFAARRNVTVTGWGALAEDGFFPTLLQKVTVPVTSDSFCRSVYGTEYQSSNMFCAGNTAGGKDSCQGDSGGPVAVKTGPNWVQVGVVSWGIGCARPRIPGVYSRISRMASFIGPFLPARAHPFYDIAPWLEDAIVWVNSAGFMSGFADGTFRPDGNITRAQAIRLLWQVKGAPVQHADHGFPDVPPWVDPAVRWAAFDPDGAGPQESVIEGFPDNTFRPDAPITRGAWTRILFRVQNPAGSPPPHGFTDVPPWVTDAVSWITDPASSPPFAAGFPDNTYRPLAPITRGQTTRMVFRIFAPA